MPPAFQLREFWRCELSGMWQRTAEIADFFRTSCEVTSSFLKFSIIIPYALRARNGCRSNGHPGSDHSYKIFYHRISTTLSPPTLLPHSIPPTASHETRFSIRMQATFEERLERDFSNYIKPAFPNVGQHLRYPAARSVIQIIRYLRPDCATEQNPLSHKHLEGILQILGEDPRLWCYFAYGSIVSTGVSATGGRP